MERRLRVHHLLCSALFVGKGYSDAFIANMKQVVDMLFSEEQEENIILVTKPDLICSACPNQVEGACVLDDNNVVSKDEALAEALGLFCNHRYRKEEILRLVREHLTKEIFETSCHRCRWYREGLCHYEALQQRYEQMIS